MNLSINRQAGSFLSLEGQLVLVTGGGRGLGLAIARGFAKAGARVAIAGRTLETLRLAVKELSTAGAEVKGYAADVSSERDVVELKEQIENDWGVPDAIVNNAGINPWYAPSESTPIEQWQQIVDVNLTGVFLCSKVFGSAMLRRGSGSIVNVTSVAAHSGLSRSAAYCAAKAGVEGLSRSLALDWSSRGVRVNCVAPAYFETDLTAGLRGNEGLTSRVLARTPMGRFGRPEEVVGACVFLASSAATYITGQSLGVDGGWTAA